MTEQIYNGNLTGEEQMMLSLTDPNVATFEDTRKNLEEQQIMEMNKKDQELKDINTVGDPNGGSIIAGIAPIVLPMITKGVSWIINKIKERREKRQQQQQQGSGRLYASSYDGSGDLYAGYGDVHNLVNSWAQENADELRNYESNITSQRGSAFYRDLKNVAYNGIKDIMENKLHIPSYEADELARQASAKVIPSREKEISSHTNGSGKKKTDLVKSAIKNTSKYALGKILKDTKIGGAMSDKNSAVRKALNEELSKLDESDYEGEGEFWNKVKQGAKKILLKVVPKFVDAAPSMIEKTINFILGKIGVENPVYKESIGKMAAESTKPILSKFNDYVKLKLGDDVPPSQAPPKAGRLYAAGKSKKKVYHIKVL